MDFTINNVQGQELIATGLLGLGSHCRGIARRVCVEDCFLLGSGWAGKLSVIGFVVMISRTLINWMPGAA